MFSLVLIALALMLKMKWLGPRAYVRHIRTMLKVTKLLIFLLLNLKMYKPYRDLVKIFFLIAATEIIYLYNYLFVAMGLKLTEG